MPRRIIETPCKCGCGEITRNGGYVRGHHTVRRWELVRAIDATTERGDSVYSRETGHYMDGRIAGAELASRGWLLPDARRHFGIELEVIAPSIVACERALRTARVPFADSLRGYHGRVAGQWTITSDSSVRANDAQRARGVSIGVEIVSPPLKGKKGLAAVRRVVNALAANGVEVNKTCGAHVHHEARDFGLNEFKAIVRNYSTIQHSVDAVLAPSRRAGMNRYCQTFTPRELERIASNLSGLHGLVDRYHVLNLSSFATYGTVEFRQHQGSLNAEKLVNWILAGQAMMRGAKRGFVATPEMTFADALAAIGTDDTVSSYFENRALSFERA